MDQPDPGRPARPDSAESAQADLAAPAQPDPAATVPSAPAEPAPPALAEPARLGPAEPVRHLRRQMHWLQAIVLLGFAAIAGALYWQSRVIGDQLDATERPFIAFKQPEFLPVIGTGQPAWQFVGTWENAGNTNAVNLRAQVSVWAGPGLQEGFTKSEAAPNPIGPLTLGPRTSVTVPDFTLPAETLVAAKQTPGYVAFWGVARYDEARPYRPSHTTRFCYFITWVGGDPMRDTRLDVRFNACRVGNCTDESCLAQGYSP
jgi:hypothetical protein